MTRKIKRIFVGLLTSNLVLSGMALTASAGNQDGKYYFNQMKSSIIEIIDEHQELINKNPDGSIKTKALLPKNFYKKVYKTFKTIVGADFSVKKLSKEKDPAVVAHMLGSLLQAERVTTAKSQKIINTEQDGSIKLKKFIPAVFGKLTAAKFQEKTGVVIKQTTSGKSDYKARNPYNLPDDWETAKLNDLSSPGWPLNKGLGKQVNNEYRYIKPIYIKKACLTCHGGPVGEKGPYGHPKEGYEVGDVRGGISIRLTSTH